MFKQTKKKKEHIQNAEWNIYRQEINKTQKFT